MKRILPLLAALALCAPLAPPVHAGLVQISLVPSAQKVHLGENLFVDIRISGLQSGGANTLGAWSFDLGYDSSLFIPLLVPPAGYGPWLGDVFAGEAVGSVDTATPGRIAMSLTSLLTPAELDALQRDAAGGLLDDFTLATMGFYAPLDATFMGGSTWFTTGQIVLGDAYGNPLSDASGTPLTVQHLPLNLLVTEPATLALALAGLAGALVAGAARDRRPAAGPDR